MRTGRSNLFIAMLVGFLVLGGSWVVQSASGQAPAQPAANDIELAKPPKYPQLITPTTEGGGLLDNHHGDAMLMQEFLFNPSTHELSLSKNSPTKQRMYGDSKIDSAKYGTDLNIFDYLTSDRNPIGKIVLLSANKKLTISYNYVVSPTTTKTTPIDPSTYCAAVQFVKGEECTKPGTTVTMHKNTEAPAPLADTQFSKINRKTDVVTWTIERGGAVVKSGSFGFPVVATAPDLVKYVIQLP